ncbi:dimethylaniline monooxygenase (N-oxide-forming) [Trametes cingulata]|nr:dimethylaniline monooxygenase (N-oxide-forming) [Trametes cingulata]
MAPQARTVAARWLADFAHATKRGDSSASPQLFLSQGWLRDVLVFTWDLRALAGSDKVRSYLSQHLAAAKITDIHIDESIHLAPDVLSVPQISSEPGVEFAFKFQCTHGLGRAHARLLPDDDGTYKVLSLLMELCDLPGHEELATLPLRDDILGIPGRDMQKEFAEWVRQVETEPYVLIVGAGHAGLQTAARFKQMDIPALVIERHPRVGDIWRRRYPSLALHTPKRHHTLLYQPFPTNWPVFTPRDKLADWLEQYVQTQDLVVWTSTEIVPKPTYDHEKKHWDVTLLREGREVHLRPAHIVFATGTLGKPNVHQIPGEDTFQGERFHSNDYQGGDGYSGKRAVVVGSGNSSIDICQDLALHGAASVTMIQRSATCVLGRDYIAGFLRLSYPEDVPLAISDFKMLSMPLGLVNELSKADAQARMEANKDLHDKLRAGGVELNMAEEGIYILAQSQLGGKSWSAPQVAYMRTEESGSASICIFVMLGYWLDKGGADLIAEGRIAVKSGVSPRHFTEKGVVLSDGSELPADVVVLATGYINIRQVTAEILGEDVIEKVDGVYGFDREYEISGSYRPCGYPGLWFTSGDVALSRSMSKPLALQIKAIQLGLLKHDGKRLSVFPA